MAFTNVYGIICDLVFGSQIQQAVTSCGLNYRSFRSSQDAEKALLESGASLQNDSLWVVNLAAKSTAEPAIVAAILPKIIASGAKVICYAPHVEEARMAWAESIGATAVVPRGALIRTIGEALAAN